MTVPEIRPSSRIRQDFLDFFKSKGHTIVPSSSLMPDAPNLLFTNAGMNQFVPVFLGQKKADVSQWAGVVPGRDTRAADTQKCIRAGGKHNDLEDVGLDTYHHTFFEMLGNWSFGDYFKAEAIAWAWELITEVWKFPPPRLYATVYQPGAGDPAQFDQEAYDHWARLFAAAGLDPKIHIRTGGKQDNFWMMGDTGPCGPCSEIHFDLTAGGDTRGELVNAGSAQCIEIWNLVFIQFNANPDGTFAPLPARHVDTGMGFERVASMLQCTRNFTDFSRPVSNYETDIFRPLFDALEKLSGRKYGSTLPEPGGVGANEQEKIDVAFRVVADHIRTLGFAIADGIRPGNTDRNYVLRRILRRAVRYGRALGFREPFFYKLVEVLADTMGHVFPEIRAKKNHVQEVIRVEEEAFNRTLDRGLEMFNQEAERLAGRHPAVATKDGLGSARVPRAGSGVPAEPAAGARYSRRNLPHFEKPWAIYVVDFRTHAGRQLSALARDIIFDCILHWRNSRYRLIAACVMPDHVHFILQPGVQAQDARGQPVFWPLSDLLHSIKSFSANEINKAEHVSGPVWQEERFDRYLRSDRDLEEKFHYLCRNPWAAGLVSATQPWPWLWTEEIEAAGPYVPPARLPYAKTVGQVARQNGLVARSTPQSQAADAARLPRSADGTAATNGSGGTGYQPVAAGNLPAASGATGSPDNLPRITGEFAFKLYDTYGFPLDLTELMARERGLTVDIAGFNKLMDEQRERARKAQKKEVVELSQIETITPTNFVGYETLSVQARVLEVVRVKDRTAVILDASACYAEMGGQVGDTGELEHGGGLWRLVNTQKSGHTWVHYLEARGPKSDDQGEELELPAVGSVVTLSVDRPRRESIQRHHTVTHLLHWALHEVVSREATQKGSYVGPDKLTFDFNSQPLTPEQVADVERLVNERILENAMVSWTEVPYAEVRSRKEVMQFFGDKYGEVVRVVQIGGGAGELNGYSMELCGGTHTRATGEIGLFRIVAESAIAAGVRRVEAVAGLEAYRRANDELHLVKSIAAKVNAPVGELATRIESLLAQQKEAEKRLKALAQQRAAEEARGLVARAKTVNGVETIIEHCGEVDGDTVQAMVNALKGQFKGVIVLGGAVNGAVALVASVSPEFTSKFQAGKIIQAIAPIVGGKGGGKPDNARGGGKEVAKLEAALAKARELLG